VNDNTAERNPRPAKRVRRRSSRGRAVNDNTAERNPRPAKRVRRRSSRGRAAEDREQDTATTAARPSLRRSNRVTDKTDFFFNEEWESTYNKSPFWLLVHEKKPGYTLEDLKEKRQDYIEQCDLAPYDKDDDNLDLKVMHKKRCLRVPPEIRRDTPRATKQNDQRAYGIHMPGKYKGNIVTVTVMHIDAAIRCLERHENVLMLRGKIASHNCHCGDEGCSGLGRDANGNLVVHYAMEERNLDCGRYHKHCKLHLIVDEAGNVKPASECDCNDSEGVAQCLQVWFNAKEDCDCWECESKRHREEWLGNNVGRSTRSRSESF